MANERHRLDWSEEETLKLIEIWGEDSVQAELEGCKRNKQVYEKIVRGMRAAGYNRTFVQCREKIKKIRTEYKRVKDHNDESGRDRKDFVYFEKLDTILGHRPATQPEHVIDTSAPETLGHHEAELSTAVEEDEKESYTDSTGDMLREDGHVESLVEDRNIKTKKRKRPVKEGMLEKAMDMVLTKIMKVQEESGKKMCELEAKRMELEERMLEIEERHWRDQLEREDQYRREQQRREDERRREERQFQLNMMQLMHGQPSYLPSAFNPLESTSPESSHAERMYHWPPNPPN